jgi:hypothetical protein
MAYVNHVEHRKGWGVRRDSNPIKQGSQPCTSSASVSDTVISSQLILTNRENTCIVVKDRERTGEKQSIP